MAPCDSESPDSRGIHATTTPSDAPPRPVVLRRRGPARAWGTRRGWGAGVDKPRMGAEGGIPRENSWQVSLATVHLTPTRASSCAAALRSFLSFA